MATSEKCDCYYCRGFRAGRADKLLGIRSEYAWFAADSEGYAVGTTGRGYRDGWLDRENKHV